MDNFKPTWVIFVLMTICIGGHLSSARNTVHAATEHDELTDILRTKRQAQDARSSGSASAKPLVASTQSMLARASASALATSNFIPADPAAQQQQQQQQQPPPDAGPNPKAPVFNRPRRPSARPDIASADKGRDDEEDQMEPPRPVRRRRPPMQPRYNLYEEPDEDEDCDNFGDEPDYGSMFRMATRPMRQLSTMMGSMFDQMQNLASGDFQDYPDGGGGGNYAMASSRNDGQGYSRQSSIVNNNGRTRGIITETRNGRTKTRRIGEGNDEDSEY